MKCAFNQEKALVGAFSVIVKTGCGTDGSFYSTTEGTITGYERIHLAFPSNGAGRAWGGLGRSGDTETALLDDTGSSPSWWMAVGATEYYHPNKKTIPGPWSLPIDGIKKIELYVKPGPHLLPTCKYS